MDNAIFAIHPYKHQGLWVFDDDRVGLKMEPFVAGVDEIIDQMVASIPSADQGFTLLFASAPFPGHNGVFEWRRNEMGGAWYYNATLNAEGWLCPALFKYFATAPKTIYAQFKKKAV